ncbi:MAG TPA: serine protease [Stenomitos sp.]
MKRFTSLAMSFWALAGLAGAQLPAAAQTEFSSQTLSRISRIVGGTVAPNHAYPWVVALETTGGFQFCAGTLISRTKVLTAAHCTNLVSKANVRVGTNVLTQGTLIPVASQKRHPKYDDFTLDYDVAIWTLAKPVTLSKNVNVIGLPGACTSLTCTSGLAKPGTLLRTIGWGRLTEGGITPIDLRQVDVPVVSNTKCNQPISYGGAVTKRMLCAGFDAGGKDSCQGDSGGPLFGNYNATTRKAVQSGIVSTGDGCARPNKYGIYTRISNPEVRQFIKQQASI